MIDLHGFEVDAEEKELLQHPFVGGVILFSRNFHDVEQINSLTKTIKQVAKQPILIAVDHEGGRVQRFRQGFSPIPAMRQLGQANQLNLDQDKLAMEMGWLMASEVKSVGIDLSFAPVLDIDGISDVITCRAFHHQPDKIKALASAFILGMRQAGMAATGKHFPGHGNVKADSHVAAAIDTRSKETIFNLDMHIFKQLIDERLLDGIMPAHVIYPEVDDKPAGFSTVWLQTILKQKLNYQGVIFSDDLSMKAANIAGDYVGKAQAALSAGCDMILACNNRQGAISILDHHTLLLTDTKPCLFEKMSHLIEPKPHLQRLTKAELEKTNRWQTAHKLALNLADQD